MPISTEADKTKTSQADENSAILRELDELMDYVNADSDQASETHIDPAFFIGDIHENEPDVPTLTTVADGSVAKRPIEEKRPGLFSARIERIKQKDLSEPAEALEVSQDELARMVDSLVAENLPGLEAQLREKIADFLRGKTSA